jgi:hypothetical protein
MADIRVKNSLVSSRKEIAGISRENNKLQSYGIFRRMWTINCLCLILLRPVCFFASGNICRVMDGENCLGKGGGEWVQQVRSKYNEVIKKKDVS